MHGTQQGRYLNTRHSCRKDDQRKLLRLPTRQVPTGKATTGTATASATRCSCFMPDSDRLRVATPTLSGRTEFKMSACPELNRTPVTTKCGIIVDTYACSNENQPVMKNGQFINEYQPAGIGTICHEFSHCLGFPGHYDTSKLVQLRNGYMGSGCQAAHTTATV